MLILKIFTRLDYIDVFFWGWIGANDGSNLHDCLQLSPDLRGANSVYQRSIERMVGVSERLKKMGAVRYISASFHDMNLAQQWSNSPLLDVIMVRHNVAHRFTQSQVFNQLDKQDPQRPGIVTFKSTGSHTGPLWDLPQGLRDRLLPRSAWDSQITYLRLIFRAKKALDRIEKEAKRVFSEFTTNWVKHYQ